jgi:hypothetical protein
MAVDTAVERAPPRGWRSHSRRWRLGQIQFLQQDADRQALATTTPADSCRGVWSALLSEQGEVVRATRDFSERLMALKQGDRRA